MLFTDSNVITSVDLARFEGTITTLAQTHNIDLAAKISLSSEEVGDRLLLWLLRAGVADPQFLNRRLIGLTTVVVTSPLKRWLCFDTLAKVFAEAYNTQLNDRFRGKWDEYAGYAANAAASMFQAGIGIVYSPLPQPPAPQVTLGPGNLGAGTVSVAAAWVDSSGRESGLSISTDVKLPANSTVSVTMAGPAPLPAAGWNLYVASTPTVFAGQNAMPLAAGLTWKATGPAFVTGPAPTGGQQPDYYVNDEKRFLRG